jgi:hypothetical protein
MFKQTVEFRQTTCKALCTLYQALSLEYLRSPEAWLGCLGILFSPHVLQLGIFRATPNLETLRLLMRRALNRD